MNDAFKDRVEQPGKVTDEAWLRREAASWQAAWTRMISFLSYLSKKGNQPRPALGQARLVGMKRTNTVADSEELAAAGFLGGRFGVFLALGTPHRLALS